MIYPMNKLETIFKKDHMVKRILMSIFGVLICGIAVGFFKRAMFGVDPFQSLMAGLVCVILGVGLYFLSGATIDGIGAVIGAGTIITAFFMGPLVDFFARKLAKPFLYGKASAEK